MKFRESDCFFGFPPFMNILLIKLSNRVVYLSKIHHWLGGGGLVWPFDHLPQGSPQMMLTYWLGINVRGAQICTKVCEHCNTVRRILYKKYLPHIGTNLRVIFWSAIITRNCISIAHDFHNTYCAHCALFFSPGLFRIAHRIFYTLNTYFCTTLLYLTSWHLFDWSVLERDT